MPSVPKSTDGSKVDDAAVMSKPCGTDGRKHENHIPGVQEPDCHCILGAGAPPSGFDAVVRSNSERMMKEGQQTFRFDTFGSEAFWGDALQLHKAIAGEKNGGVARTSAAVDRHVLTAGSRHNPSGFPSGLESN